MVNFWKSSLLRFLFPSHENLPISRISCARSVSQASTKQWTVEDIETRLQITGFDRYFVPCCVMGEIGCQCTVRGCPGADEILRPIFHSTSWYTNPFRKHMNVHHPDIPPVPFVESEFLSELKKKIERVEASPATSAATSLLSIKMKRSYNDISALDDSPTTGSSPQYLSPNSIPPLSSASSSSSSSFSSRTSFKEHNSKRSKREKCDMEEERDRADEEIRFSIPLKLVPSGMTGAKYLLGAAMASWSKQLTQAGHTSTSEQLQDLHSDLNRDYEVPLFQCYIN